MNTSWFNLKQSVTEVTSLLCITLIISAFLGLVTFIGLQGIRYFIPSNVHLVTITYPDRDEQRYFQQETTDKETLLADINVRLVQQYSDNPAGKPTAQVTTIENVIEATTDRGERLYGTFDRLTSDTEEKLPIESLDNLLLTVNLLQSQLHDVQENQLMPIHRAIAILNERKVDRDVELYRSLKADFARWQAYVTEVNRRLSTFALVMVGADSQPIRIALDELDKLHFPNDLTFIDKIAVFFERISNFLLEPPKQAATSGGVFPAIFGTVLMVILMAVVVSPIGVIAAIYLYEYAPENKTTMLIRIGVSNMAAVPSVVYGVFGLGFFVYTLGGSIDQLIYAEKLPSPTFGAPGLLWASLTMGLLTLPVVIVATEEGLSRVPKGQRQGSYALGATKLETIFRVVLPMASPGILTGLILAVARAAGEVAPLILVGAVKFAPSLPVDTTFPFLHLERQFMHLGVFIYDGAFHSQIDANSASIMFASCMLLIFIVFALNITAIVFRSKLRERYERSLL
ncbi:MAG: phosphate ABC transporter permease PstA [Pseudomonadota bacterium]